MQTALAICLLGVVFASSAMAAGAIRVTPVVLSVSAPAAVASLKLENNSDRPANMQIRVFAWSQRGGKDVLEPAAGVVASPPLVKLGPGEEQVVRVLRVDTRPIEGVEEYRLLIDQLPDPADRQNGRVAMVLRQSVPVFFSAHAASAPRMNWTIKSSNGSLVLTATNGGDAAIRIANPALEAGNVRRSLSDGLLGYVLGGSTMTWTIPLPASAPPSNGPAVLSFRSDSGIVNVPVVVGSGG